MKRVEKSRGKGLPRLFRPSRWTPRVIATTLAIAVAASVSIAATPQNGAAPKPDTTLRDPSAGRAGTPTPELEVQYLAQEREAYAQGAIEVGLDGERTRVALFPKGVDPAGVSGLKIKISPYTISEYAAAEATVKDIGMSRTEGFSYSQRYDVETGQIIVTSGAPESKLDRLRKASTDIIRVEGGRSVTTTARNADPQPHLGGAAITVGAVPCSSGPVVKQGNGNMLQLTAGHCGGIGASVSYGGFGPASIVNSAYPTWDQALIGGTTFSPHIYFGNQTTSTVVKQVGAGASAVGLYYYTSGRTTGSQGHYVVSTNVTFNDWVNGYSWANIIYLSTPASQGGDSGGTVHTVSGSNAGVRGMVLGTDGVGVFAEPWSRIASRWSVTIAT